MLEAAARTQKMASASCDFLAFPGRDKPKSMLQPLGLRFPAAVLQLCCTVEFSQGFVRSTGSQGLRGNSCKESLGVVF